MTPLHTPPDRGRQVSLRERYPYPSGKHSHFGEVVGLLPTCARFRPVLTPLGIGGTNAHAPLGQLRISRAIAVKRAVHTR